MKIRVRDSKEFKKNILRFYFSMNMEQFSKRSYCCYMSFLRNCIHIIIIIINETVIIRSRGW